MKKKLNLHDSQILKIITNPVTGCMQIILSCHSDEIMEIQIEGIKRVKQNNIDCLSLFYESGGGIDDDYLEETGTDKTLFLSGILDFDCEKYENVIWSFYITAEKINILHHKISMKKTDLLYEDSFISFNELISNDG